MNSPEHIAGGEIIDPEVEQLRSEYSRLIESEWNQDAAIDKLVRGVLKRIRFLAIESEHPLRLTENNIGNYSKIIFHRANRDWPESVRSARFLNGLYFSVRLGQREKTMVEHELEFYDDGPESDLPLLTTRKLNDFNQDRPTPSQFTVNPLKFNEIYDHPVPSLIIDSYAAIKAEATSNTPWSNAFTHTELRSARKATGSPAIRVRPHEKRPADHDAGSESARYDRYIGINPELNQPYL